MPVSKCALPPPPVQISGSAQDKETTIHSQAGDNYWFLATAEPLSFLP